MARRHFKHGDSARLTPGGGDGRGELGGRALRPGADPPECGEVIGVASNAQPVMYRVRGPRGESDWYKAADLVPAQPPPIARLCSCVLTDADSRVRQLLPGGAHALAARRAAGAVSADEALRDGWRMFREGKRRLVAAARQRASAEGKGGGEARGGGRMGDGGAGTDTCACGGAWGGRR
eukprot:gene2425-633_t